MQVRLRVSNRDIPDDKSRLPVVFTVTYHLKVKRAGQHEQPKPLKRKVLQTQTDTTSSMKLLILALHKQKFGTLNAKK